jgi:hypothetical protein
VGLSLLGTAAPSGLLYKPQMIDEGDFGAIGGMKIGRGNRCTRRKPASAPLCPPQIPHDQTWVRTPGRRGGKPAINRLSYGGPFTLSKKDLCFVNLLGFKHRGAKDSRTRHVTRRTCWGSLVECGWQAFMNRDMFHYFRRP